MESGIDDLRKSDLGDRARQDIGDCMDQDVAVLGFQSCNGQLPEFFTERLHVLANANRGNAGWTVWTPLRTRGTL